MRRVFTLGESLLDIVFMDGQPVVSKPGGSMLNVSVSLGRTGATVYHISEFGKDQVGTILLTFLRENGVHTDYCKQYENGQSALALAFLDENRNATYNFYKSYPVNRLDQDLPVFTADDIFVFGSYYGIAPEIREKVRNMVLKAKEAGCIIIYDPNFRKTYLSKLTDLMPDILENIKDAHIIKGSNEDFENIFGTKEPGKIWNLLKDNRKILMITAGREGASCYGSGIFFRQEGISIEPVSTIGAGDNFNAGMIVGLIQNQIYPWNFRESFMEYGHLVLDTGIKFATHCCLNLDNYVSCDFANGFNINDRKGQ